MAWNNPSGMGIQTGQSSMGARQLPYQQSQPSMGQPQGGITGGGYGSPEAIKNWRNNIPGGGKLDGSPGAGDRGNVSRGIPFGGGQTSMPVPAQSSPQASPMGYANSSMRQGRGGPWGGLLRRFMQRRGGGMNPNRGGWGNGPDVIGGPKSTGGPITTGGPDLNNPSTSSPYQPPMWDSGTGMGFPNPNYQPQQPQKPQINPNIGNGTGSNSRTSNDWLKRHPEEAGGNSGNKNPMGYPWEDLDPRWGSEGPGGFDGNAQERRRQWEKTGQPPWNRITVGGFAGRGANGNIAY